MEYNEKIESFINIVKLDFKKNIKIIKYHFKNNELRLFLEKNDKKVNVNIKNFNEKSIRKLVQQFYLNLT